MRFRNRREAGCALGRKLETYKDRSDVLVLGLPRGGVPVAYEVALALHAPMDVFLVRKLGVPGHEELAMGAIATGNIRILNAAVIQEFNISCEQIEAATARESVELMRRECLYRGDRTASAVSGRTIIVVDDGLATGSTMRAAITALRSQDPARVVIAVPIASASTPAEFQKEADEVVCAMTAEPFQAVGLWYEDFGQTSDAEVTDLIQRTA